MALALSTLSGCIGTSSKQSPTQEESQRTEEPATATENELMDEIEQETLEDDTQNPA
jgi:hypothetical protein